MSKLILRTIILEVGQAGDANVEAVGTLTLEFHNCNQGRAIFDTPEEVLGAGEFRIKRLTSIYRSRCSGGISDDTPAHARPIGASSASARITILIFQPSMFARRRS